MTARWGAGAWPRGLPPPLPPELAPQQHYSHGNTNTLAVVLSAAPALRTLLARNTAALQSSAAASCALPPSAMLSHTSLTASTGLSTSHTPSVAQMRQACCGVSVWNVTVWGEGAAGRQGGAAGGGSA